MLKEIRSFIESRKKELRSLSDDIWNHPEVAYTENMPWHASAIS